MMAARGNFFRLLGVLLFTALFTSSCYSVKEVDSFYAPDPGGLGFDGTCFWLAGTEFIWKLSTSGTIIKSYPSPGVHGIAFADTCFYAISPSGTLYRLDFDMQVLDSFKLDFPILASDLAFDGTNLWLLDFFAENVYKIDTAGNLLDVIDSPCPNPGGLTFDGTHLWISGNSKYSMQTLLYKLTTDGCLIKKMHGPAIMPMGIVVADEYLWLNAVEYRTKSPKIYKCEL